MLKILAISGSLRQGSFNTALLRAAAGLMPAGATLDVATLHGIPLYDGDVEANEGIPAAVQALKERIMASDGLVFATPEYNNSIPGVFKNAIDWLSRPPTDIAKVFKGRPVALMGASTGPFGTTLAQTAWLPVLRVLGMDPWFGPKLLVTRAAQVFNEAHEVVDAPTKEHLTQYLQGYVDWLNKNR